MMKLRTYSRTREYDERSVARMSKWRLRSSSSTPGQLPSSRDQTAPRRMCARILEPSPRSRPAIPAPSPFKVCASTSSNRASPLPAVAGSYSAASLHQLSSPSPSPARSNKRCAEPNQHVSWWQDCVRDCSCQHLTIDHGLFEPQVNSSS